MFVTACFIFYFLHIMPFWKLGLLKKGKILLPSEANSFFLV